MKLDHPFFLNHENFEVAQQAFKDKNADAWLQAWNDLDQMYPNHFQQLVNVCIDADWADGVMAMKKATQDNIGSWLWSHKTDLVRNPDVPLARALQQAKPAVVRALLPETPPMYLHRCLMIGAPSEQRKLGMTRARSRSLGSVARYIEQYSANDKKILVENDMFVKVILDIPDFAVVSTLLEPFSNQDVWNTLVTDVTLKTKHSDFNTAVFHSKQSHYFDVLWQHTHIQQLADHTRDMLTTMVNDPRSVEHVPYIASSFSRAVIQEAVDETAKSNKRKKIM